MPAHYANYQYRMTSMTYKQLCINPITAIHMLFCQEPARGVIYGDSRCGSITTDANNPSTLINQHELAIIRQQIIDTRRAIP